MKCYKALVKGILLSAVLLLSFSWSAAEESATIQSQDKGKSLVDRLAGSFIRLTSPKYYERDSRDLVSKIDVIGVKYVSDKIKVYFSGPAPTTIAWLGGVNVEQRDDAVIGEAIDEVRFVRCVLDGKCSADYPVEWSKVDVSDSKYYKEFKYRVVNVVEIPNSGRILRFK